MNYFKIIAWGECPFCVKAKALLIEHGFQFEYVVVDHSRDLLNFYKSNYKQDTVPIIVYREGFDEEFIGGYTDLKRYIEEGTGRAFQ